MLCSKRWRICHVQQSPSSGLPRSREYALSFFKVTAKLSTKEWQQFIITATKHKSVGLSKPHQHQPLPNLSNFAILMGGKQHLVALICVSLISDVLLDIYHASSEEQRKRCTVGFKMIYYKIRDRGPQRLGHYPTIQNFYEMINFIKVLTS